METPPPGPPVPGAPPAPDEAAAPASEGDEPAAEARAAAVSLRQRVWPMVEMLRRAQAADEPVVWGV